MCCSSPVLAVTPGCRPSWPGQGLAWPARWPSRATSEAAIFSRREALLWRGNEASGGRVSQRGERALEVPRPSAPDLHLDDFTGQRLLALEVHEFVGARAAVPSPPGGTLDKDLDRTAEIARVDLRGDALLQELDFVQTSPLFFARHVVAHLGRRDGARA